MRKSSHISEKKEYHAIGLMSGTSLDGLDIAFVTFSKNETKWDFSCTNAATAKIPTSLVKQIQSVYNGSARELAQLNVDFGIFSGKTVADFIKKHKLKPDFIASHGQTIFHEPNKSMTYQAGNGAAIAAITGITTVCDFRSTDICLGGQGAPLVPVGDELLFRDFDFCLNLGGFSNISFRQNRKRIAFDICPVNIVLNHLANRLGKPFDNNGKIAESGTLILPLFEKLNKLSFYKQNPPKSLGWEWVEKKVMPLLEEKIKTQDLLRTYTEHIAEQISNIVNQHQGKNVLITGGGAYNDFMVQLLKSKTNKDIVLPENKIIDYKEAIIFAFLGLLRILNIKNCLKSVTGSSTDSIGGAVYLGNSKLDSHY